MAAPPKFLMSQHATYPDDDDAKTLSFSIDDGGADPSEKHVYIMWSNGSTSDGSPVTQLIQLYGNPGSYQFYHPVVKIRRPSSLARYRSWDIGVFDRAQRDLIVELG